MIAEHSSKNKFFLLIIFTILLLVGIFFLLFKDKVRNTSKAELAQTQDIVNAFFAKYPDWDKPGFFSVAIEDNSPSHAIGRVSWPGNDRNGLWFAAKVDGQWLITDYTGGGYFGICKNFKKYDFPQMMTPDCWDEDQKIIINTPNPNRFYNGLNFEDKEKIIQAFLDYTKNDEFFMMSQDLYVRFDEYLNGYLTGMIVMGGVDNYSTPYFLAAKVGDTWTVLYHGQEAPPCESLSDYDVPVKMIPNCYNSDGTAIIERQ